MASRRRKGISSSTSICWIKQGYSRSTKKRCFCKIKRMQSFFRILRVLTALPYAMMTMININGLIWMKLTKTTCWKIIYFSIRSQCIQTGCLRMKISFWICLTRISRLLVSSIIKLFKTNIKSLIIIKAKEVMISCSIKKNMKIKSKLK